MYLYQKVEELTLQCHGARKTIGEFILKQNNNLINYTMEEIAKLTYSSKASLVRFAKSLGYNGWNDFIKDYVKELLFQEKYQFSIDVNIPFNESSSLQDIYNNIASVEIETIQMTKDLISIKTLNIAIDYLLNANKIVIFCVSSNIHLANLFKYKMLSIGKEVTVVQDGEAHFWIQILNEFDCAIIISYSGNNEHREPECYIKELNKRNVKLIGITSIGDNYIHNNIDCIFQIVTLEKLYSKIASFSSEQAILYVLNIIYSCYFKNNYKINYNHKVNNSKIYEAGRKTIVNNIKD